MKIPERAVVRVYACGIFAEPTFKSEMVNQAILWEEVLISDKKNNWYKIQLKHDGYEGWIHEMYLNHDKETVDKLYSESIFKVYRNKASLKLGSHSKFSSKNNPIILRFILIPHSLIDAGTVLRPILISSLKTIPSLISKRGIKGRNLENNSNPKITKANVSVTINISTILGV